MGASSAIEWTDVTWNPVTGCDKISPGCRFCYAERLAKRLQLMGNPRYASGFQVTLHADQVTLPLRWRQPRMIFVNSMSDLFHDDVPLAFIDEVFDVMRCAKQHTFQVLTKRPDRLVLWHRGGEALKPIPDNVWIGVSVESSRYAWRVDRLRQVEARTRFISAEPLLGPLSGLDLTGISWLITGGESGGSRGRSLVEQVAGAWRPKPTAIEWVRALRDHCLAAEVAFFHKQWGGPTPKTAGRKLDGQQHSAYPASVTAGPDRR
jgi:protein gp37